jgi:deoxyribonuclease-4
MPLFGAHLSIAGGLHKAAKSAEALGCETVQLFTASPNSWRVASAGPGTARRWVGKPLPADEVTAFRKAVRTAKLKHPTAHDSYLINLAAPDDELHRKSIDAFTHELEQAEALGLSYLVSHPRAHTGSGEVAGLARVVAALDEVHARCAGFKVKVLIENTAGQGSSLGARFEELAAILDRVADPDRLGVCFDTCHAFAAGYPLAAEADYAATFHQLDDLIGLANLKSRRSTSTTV